MSVPRARWGPATLLACGACACAATVLWECSIYDTSLLVASIDAGGDAPVVVPTQDGSIDADTCGHTRWPARPDGADNGKAVPEIVNAFKTLDFGPDKQGDSGRPLGFDLDGVCTCPGPESCVPLKSAQPHCDLEGGRDNAVGSLLSTLASVSPSLFDTAGVNTRLQAGFYGLVFRIRNYDGSPDDPRVEVSVYVSSGSEGDPPDAGKDASTDAGDGGDGDAGSAFTPSPPKYDGTDRWSVDPGSLLGGVTLAGINCDNANIKCTPVFVDSQGYVANNQLVARLDFPLALGSGAGLSSVVIDLVGSVVTAKLVPDGKTFRVDEGQIAGRWATAKLLTSLQQLHDPFDSKKFLCGTDPVYQNLKALICKGSDVTTDIKQDGTNTPCDALSAAIGFTGTPAHLGIVRERPTQPPSCGATYRDDCNNP